MLKSMLMNYKFISILVKLIFSGLISILMMLLSIITAEHPFLLFISFTVLNYISVEAVLRIFTTSVSSFYDTVIGELYLIQKDYINKSGLSEEKKRVLKYKFIHVREHFLKSVLSMQYLRNNNFDPEIEIENFKAIAIKTVELYEKDMRTAGVSEEFIQTFENIHEPATTVFINKVNSSIKNEKMTIIRRQIFNNELVNLMKNSVDHFVKAIKKEDKE